MDVLVVGTGEYTTGYVPHRSATSTTDKTLGVICLVLFDLRSRAKVRSVTLVGTTGRKNADIRSHLAKGIGSLYRGLDVSVVLLPDDGVDRDNDAYVAAMTRMKKGDACIIFTPDDTHHAIAREALRRGLHVLVAKPAVKLASQHGELAALARENGLVACVEMHKRFDPIYADARERARALGDFSHFAAYMSQPKSQLETFKAWAGKTSDISYYLNSHHIDFLTWCLAGKAVPVRVTAAAATGVATSEAGCVAGTEDTITLMVTFRNLASGNVGTALFTSSWIAPKAEVHSQQRFFYMGHAGEVRVDQAHRGYESASDLTGLQQHNPLFLRYQPDPLGRYAGQGTYGHRSIECFLDACTDVNAGKVKAEELGGVLPTLEETVVVTRILEAGRKSLDSGGIPVDIA
ncbi:hypothetical protein HK101_010000 [Irineochytrium annulatum]|nr:hypothetical protein HK101_010000 [Irineochytrium annulatum]